MAQRARTLSKISLISLGCPKNLVDSEVMLGRLLAEGFVLCEDPGEADIIIVNTCSFIRDAEDESAKAVEDAVRLKKSGDAKAVVLAGCMASRYGKELSARFPEVDAFVDAGDSAGLLDACQKVSGPRPSKNENARRAACPPAADVARLRITPRHFAYLRVSDGCDNRCSYCVIPKIRGGFRSKPFEAIMQEARELASDGVSELNLIAQDTSFYGSDLGGKRDIVDVVKAVSELDFKWVRLLYLHPAHVTPRLIQEIANNPKVVKYADLPIQHISDRILSEMNRNVSSKKVRELVKQMRAEIKDLVIRTSVIVGFPGETEKEFAELMDFLREVRFERLGAFTYSNEKGTRAFHMDGQVPEEEKDRRLDAVMKLQQGIAFEQNSALKGTDIECIADVIGTDAIECRTYGDAPDVDGMIFVKKAPKILLEPGAVFVARVTGAEGYDLTGDYHAKKD